MTPKPIVWVQDMIEKAKELARTKLKFRDLALKIPLYGQDYYFLPAPIRVIVALYALIPLFFLTVIKKIWEPFIHFIAAQRQPRVLRTPNNSFDILPQLGYDFASSFVPIQIGATLDRPRMHFIDVGPRHADHTLVLVHGEMSWSFVFRTMIPHLTHAGFRVIVPDLIGFGKSDKFTNRDTYTFEMHVASLLRLIEHLELENITLVGYQMGGTIGLAAMSQLGDRFTKMVNINVGLPVGEVRDNYGISGKISLYRKIQSFLPELIWRNFMYLFGDFAPVSILTDVTVKHVSPKVSQGYAAPYPSSEYQQGLYAMSQLYPVYKDDQVVDTNERMRNFLKNWNKPSLTILGKADDVLLDQGRLMAHLLTSPLSRVHSLADVKGILPEAEGPKIAKLITDFINEEYED